MSFSNVPNIDHLVSQIEVELEVAEQQEDHARHERQQLIDAARSEGRVSLSVEETERYDKQMAAGQKAKAEVKRLKAKLANATAVQAEERDQDAKQYDKHPTSAARNDAVTLYGADGSTSAMFTRTNDGRNAVVSRGQSFADNEIVREQISRSTERDRMVMGQHGDLGQLVRSISTTSGASAMVPTVWAAQVIDKARNAAVVFQAGASLVPMDAKVVQIARLTQDPAPAFRTEGNAIPATDPAFDYVQLSATSLGTVVVCSLELLQDAPNANEVVQNALAKAMALEVDKAALFGQLGATGTNDEGSAYGLASPYPKGLLKALVDYSSGSQIVGAFPTNGTAQTAATPWNEMLAVVYKVARSNEQPGAIVSNTALVQQYDGMYDTMYNPIRKPDVLANRPWLQTNVIPSYTRGTMTNRATDVFCGDWSQLLVGQRLGLEIRVLTERYAELGQVGLLAFWRGDVAVARPTAFAAYRALQGAL